MPAVPAEAEAMAVSSASCSRMVRTWASAAPKAMSSAAPSVRSTMAAARSPRTAANRDSRRRARNPVSQGTTVAASTRATARMTRRRPAASTTGAATVEDTDQHGDAERGDDPDDQVLHASRRPGPSGPAGRRAGTTGRPAGASRSSRSVDLHPEVGEQPEGGVVADQPLLVAQEPAGQPEELDGHDGHGQMRLVGVLGRPGDQPGRGADEPDVGGDGARAQQGRARTTRRDAGRTQRQGPAQRGALARLLRVSRRRASRRHRRPHRRRQVGSPGRPGPAGRVGGRRSPRCDRP